MDAVFHAVSAHIVCVYELRRTAAVCAASKVVESAIRWTSGALGGGWAPAGGARGVTSEAILRVAVVSVVAEAGLASWTEVAVWPAG